MITLSPSRGEVRSSFIGFFFLPIGRAAVPASYTGWPIVSVLTPEWWQHFRVIWGSNQSIPIFPQETINGLLSPWSQSRNGTPGFSSGFPPSPIWGFHCSPRSWLHWAGGWMVLLILLASALLLMTSGTAPCNTPVSKPEVSGPKIVFL